VGQIIRKIGRRGKYLIINLDHSFLIIHLRMTGQLLYKSDKDSNSGNHVRAKIFFTDKTALFFQDTRKFGRIYHVDAADNILYKIGIDAIDPKLDVEVFKQMINKSRNNIKVFLLSQDKIAGIGNIYADESLFLAGIHPASTASSIPASKIQCLYDHLSDVLRAAIDNMGSTISDYRDSYGNPGNNQKFFKVYQRTGEPCCNCTKPISRLKIAGRGTHFCSKCQKVYK
jgi:formamidopyrimidine-DNA glycosylase